MVYGYKIAAQNITSQMLGILTQTTHSIPEYKDQIPYIAKRFSKLAKWGKKRDLDPASVISEDNPKSILQVVHELAAVNPEMAVFEQVIDTVFPHDVADANAVDELLDRKAEAKTDPTELQKLEVMTSNMEKGIKPLMTSEELAAAEEKYNAMINDMYQDKDIYHYQPKPKL